MEIERFPSKTATSTGSLYVYPTIRVLITGHLGFVGQETERLLSERGIKVVGYDIMERRDIRHLGQLDEFVKEHKPDRILHLAAIARFADADRDPALAFETNALGTRNVAHIAALYKIPIVYASTGSVYMPIDLEPPITEDFPARGNSVYACTKYLGETYIRQTGIPWIILRYAHLYGREKRFHGLIGGYMERIQRGLAPVLYGGAQSNDFMYIKDVAMANYLALTASWDKYYQVYNIGTGEELSAEEAGKTIAKLMGYKGKTVKKKGRTVDPARFVYDISKARRMLGLNPQYTFEKGLKDFIHGAEVSSPR